MSLLLTRVEIGGRVCDLRLDGGHVAEIAASLRTAPSDDLIDGRGNALLPGLADHHVHLLALAARAESVGCGPPDVTDADGLAAALVAATPRRDGWIRGTGYHESVAGLPDRTALDRWVRDVPLRIQHRGGALWLLNSAAIQALGLEDHRADAVERDRHGAPTGRLWRGDELLRRVPAATPPSLAATGRALAALGLTALTDATATNDASSMDLLAGARRDGHLRQDVRVMGPLALSDRPVDGSLALAEVKVVLDDERVPDPADLAELVAAAHARGRATAMHCVTHLQLTVALAALGIAGVRGDRIEHASIVHPSSLERMVDLGVSVVTQPAFVSERGDRYAVDVEAEDRDWLYPIRSLLDAGVVVAGSSDAPFTAPDPWAAMRAAVTRRTPSGRVLDPAQAASPEEALAMFLRHPADLHAPVRTVRIGAPADLVLLRLPWGVARRDLRAELVATTIIAGEVVHGG